MKRILLSLILLYTCISFASIYMEQKNGVITYSDTPTSADSKQIGLPSSPNNAPGMQSAPVASSKPIINPAATTMSEETSGTYKVFQIISPKDQESIQNQASFPVEIKIEPELKKGDRVQLLVDNKLWGAPQASTHLTIDTLERGSHQIYAVIVDSAERIIQQSNTITVYNHRVNTNFKPG